ncbi:hypothetical protein [Undibacterium sp. WLHG33]|uniref:hypothetical protein n=1 Tax=Undibacterium sp. WLHG33 TaxID=3412482 RepID=UPI003C2C28B1
MKTLTIRVCLSFSKAYVQTSTDPSRAQIAEIGASTPSYHVLTSKEVRDIYTKKKEEKFKKGTKGPISFGFADVQFEQNKWIKVKNALLLNVRKAPGNNA